MATGDPPPCDTCGINPRRVTPLGAQRECNTCRRYRQRTGEPRPEYLIERELERREETRGD